MLLSGAEALLSGADGALLAVSLDFVSAEESLPAQAAVMVSADTTAVAAAILFMVRMVLSLSVGFGVIALVYKGFVASSAADWSDRTIPQPAVTLTLCQPVEPLGSMGVRLSFCV